jgi:hypothetical protein
VRDLLRFNPDVLDTLTAPFAPWMKPEESSP